MEDIERQYPKPPVIIVTAHASYREDHRMSQANGYVVKSFELGELKQNVAHALNRKPASEPVKAGNHGIEFKNSDRPKRWKCVRKVDIPMWAMRSRSLFCGPKTSWHSPRSSFIRSYKPLMALHWQKPSVQITGGRTLRICPINL